MLASYTLKEAQIENLVTAKGYADCVAFMGEDSVSVVVSTDTGELTGGGCGQDHGHRHDGDRLCPPAASRSWRQISCCIFREYMVQYRFGEHRAFTKDTMGKENQYDGRKQGIYDAAGGKRKHQYFGGSHRRHRRGRCPGCGGRVRHDDQPGRQRHGSGEQQEKRPEGRQGREDRYDRHGADAGPVSDGAVTATPSPRWRKMPRRRSSPRWRP